MTHQRNNVVLLSRDFISFPVTVQASTKVESTRISKSGINKDFQELSKVKAVTDAGSPSQDNFST